ncbi:hypothetical protein CDEF62S_05729 [Castellaniella defragrans]
MGWPGAIPDTSGMLPADGSVGASLDEFPEGACRTS